MRDKLLLVIDQLRTLFAEKNELNGFNDWDKFIGCVVLLEDVVRQIDSEASQPEKGE